MNINKENRIILMGCPVDNLDMPETLLIADKMIAEKKPHQHVVVNSAKLLQIRKDPELKRIVSQCDIINADGMPLVWASKLFGQPLKERVAGIDLMINLVKAAPGKGYRLYFLGAREEVVSKVVDKYQKEYPGVNIAGYRNGYWSVEEEDSVVEGIRNAQADILFVAISSPKKEVFLEKYLDKMNVPFVMGVGGSFDVVAGLTKRAPVWAQKTGMEWFFRLIQEPRRMWKRYLIGNTVYVCVVLKEWLKYIFKGRRS